MRDRAPGFTLIESVIALAVLMAGLAGTAALLLRTARLEREAAIEAAATRQAQALADVLRALRRPDRLPLLTVSGIDPAAACASSPEACAAELAAGAALDGWRILFADALPRGAATQISIPDPFAAEYLLTLDWPLSGGGLRRYLLKVRT